jgi:ABC-type sugar transport system substrate-binding protein
MLVWTAGAALAVGCKPEDQVKPPDREQTHIVVVGEAKDDPTWPVLQAAIRWFTDHYRLATVELQAPDSASAGRQQALLQELVGKDVDAVCLAPTDPNSLRVVVNDLVRCGKRVVTIGRDVPNSDRRMCSGPSEFEIGQAAARACEMALKGRSPTVILLHAGLQDDIYGPRYYGFKEQLRLLADVRLLREVDCGGKTLDAVHLVRTESRRYPRVGCWVLLDDWPLRVIPESDRLLPLGCGIVLCNGSPRYFPRVRDGQILAMIVFDFRRAVEEALFAAARKDQPGGARHPDTLALPAEIITVRELDSYADRWKAWARELDSL